MTPVDVPPEVLKKYCMDTSEVRYLILIVCVRLVTPMWRGVLCAVS